MGGIRLSNNDWSMEGGAQEVGTVSVDTLLNKLTYYLEGQIQFSSYYSITYAWV
ncbi:unnamed protein product, partial [Rotaria magnacalcarata]